MRIHLHYRMLHEPRDNWQTIQARSASKGRADNTSPPRKQGILVSESDVVCWKQLPRDEPDRHVTCTGMTDVSMSN